MLAARLGTTDAAERDAIAGRTVEVGIARRDLAIGTALLALFLVPNLWWVMFDRRVWPWDQAWYGEVTTDLFYLLLHQPAHWYGSVISLMPSKPPLLTWLGEFLVPIGAAAGSVDVALLIFVVLTQTATLGLIWAVGRIIAPRNAWAATAAVLFAAGAPLFVGLSHQYLVEPLQILDVAASALLALAARRLSALRLLSALILLGVAALAVKTTSFIYCGLFWGIAFVVLVRKVRGGERGYRDPLAWATLLIAVLLGAATLNWYVANMADVLSHVQSATGADAELYGHRDALGRKLLFWWQAAESSFFVGAAPWFAMLLGATTLAVLIRVVPRLLRRTVMTEDMVVLAALGHIAVTALLLSSQPNEETRFLVPLVPNVALLLTWLLGMPMPRLVSIGVAALLAVQFVLVTAQGLGGPVGAARSAWLLPINSDRADRRTMQGLVVATCPASDAGRINVVGPEFPQMNANSMSFFAAKERLSSGFRCFYTSMGYAETDVHKALTRMRDIKSDFVIFPRPSALPVQLDVFNRTLNAAEAAISSSPDYRNVGQVGNYDVFKSTAGP